MVPGDGARRPFLPYPPAVLRSAVVLAPLLLWGSSAVAVEIVTDLGTNLEIRAKDPAASAFPNLASTPSAALGQQESVTAEVVMGRSSLRAVYVNRDDELTVAHELERAGESPPRSAFAYANGVIQFRVSEPMTFELSGHLRAEDSGQGDHVYMNVALHDITRGRNTLKTFFNTYLRSDVTRDEELVLGLASGDNLNTVEGSLTGLLLPVLPNDTHPDRRYELRYWVQIYDQRDDPGDVGTRAASSITMRFTPSNLDPKPVISASKRDVHVVDLDGDRRVDPGDTIEYQIRIDNRGTAPAESVRFQDIPDMNSSLLLGSVATSGSVLSGNSAGDDQVEVEFGALPVGESRELSFDVVVDRSFPEGVQSIKNQGRVLGENFPVALTDDPDSVAASPDGTISFVANAPLDRCERERESLSTELASVAAELESTSAELMMCQQSLVTAFADSDGDGVLDLVDTCPATPAGADADALGCSLVEFCARAALAHPQRVAACRRADWGNDEPLGSRDCRWYKGACLAK